MATRKKTNSVKKTRKTKKSSNSTTTSGRKASTTRKASKRRASEGGSTTKARLTRRRPEAAELEEANPASRGARKRVETTPKPASIVSNRDGALDSYLITLEPTAKAVVEKLRALVREHAPKAQETIRWRNLCWEMDGVMCYASSAKKHVTFGFFQGSELSDPYGILETVKNKPERVVKLKDVGDINEEAFASWIREAVKLNSKRG